MREVVMNDKSNLLQLEEHFYQLVDVNVRSRKKKPQKKDSILYAKRDADTASLFGCAPCCTRF